jgi:hypothetical protein
MRESYQTVGGIGGGGQTRIEVGELESGWTGSNWGR